MSRKKRSILFSWTLGLLVGLGGLQAAHGQEFRASFGAVGGCSTGNCGTTVSAGSCYSCQKFHCPPHYKHCQEGAPRICFQHGCPKPICDPCTQPNWGYYQTCWTPWPWPPNWNHCPVQPPASAVIPGIRVPGEVRSGDPMPAPTPPGIRPGL